MPSIGSAKITEAVQAPDTSWPVAAHWLCAKVQSMTVSEPPSSKMAPSPLAVLVVFMTSEVNPSTNVRFCTVRSGVARFQALVRCRMREAPPPLSVTVPPPSMVVSLATGTSEATVIVTGSGPQSKVITPPAATAARNAASVQLAAVPVPTTVGRGRGVDRLSRQRQVALGFPGSARPARPGPRTCLAAAGNQGRNVPGM